MPRFRPSPTSLSALAACLLSAAALALQPTTPPATDKSPDKPADKPPVVEQQLPPQIRLYTRVELVRRQVPVVPLLVIVRDTESFVQAIGKWSLQGRFPILIDDDGSLRTHEHIGRFARAFKPEKIIRWSSGKGGDVKPNPALIDNAIARAFAKEGTRDPVTAEPRADLNATFKAVQLDPPGIVIANPDDPAWVGGVALAAARGQPIAWLKDLPRAVDDTLTRARFEAINAQIEKAAQATGYAWAAQADVIEAVTLACNLPITVDMDAKDTLCATTDLVGRSGSTRWAWAGQLIGTASQSAYQAMSAIFLQPSEAFLFDGYENAKDFAKYDCTAAGKVLTQAGLKVTVADEPNNTERDWRTRMAKGALAADLVFVNTMGNKEFFQLKGGTCRAGDVPFLTRPAAVHFIHSWSSRYLNARETVGGRWLERGAYLYYGSVQEPFLSAFHPTPTVATRMTAAPFAAAVRLDAGPAWKLTVVGDPLATFGPAAPKSDQLALVTLRFSGATYLDEIIAPATASKNYAGLLVFLVDMGRDADAATLAAALLKDDAGAISPEVAAAAIMPLFRASKFTQVSEMYSRVSIKDAENGILRDALWFSAYATPREQLTESTLSLLRENVRWDQLERDATDLAMIWTSVKGSASATAMLNQLRDAQPNPLRKGEVDKVIGSFRSRPAR